MKHLSNVVKKHKILKREEEFELVAAYKIPIKKTYDTLAKRFPQEEKETAKQFHNRIYELAKSSTLTKGNKYFSPGAARALDLLIKHNIRIILKYSRMAYLKESARKKGAPNLETYDHFVEGLLGFIHGLDKFDQTKVTKEGLPLRLGTYVFSWIKQSIRRGIQDKEATIRIPIHIHDQVDKLRRVFGQWCSEHPESLSPPPKQLAEIYNKVYPEEKMDEDTALDWVGILILLSL